MHTIDINCDVGEGVGNEQEILPLISSCNIACGGHAGDENTIRTVLQLALKNNVKIGAHPSYPDKENFGRQSIFISDENLKESIKNQLAFFLSILKEEKGVMHHIKAHGALYNDIAKTKNLATVFLDSIKDYKTDAILYVPYNSVVAFEAQKRGFTIAFEAFADRNYNDDLSLVSRKEPNSLLKEGKTILAHIKEMVINGRVKTINNNFMSIISQTYCIHGDTVNASEILMYLDKELPNHNITVLK
ncbi:5-oxoprolinase subunit PxpA [Cellulophaga baltica]|uniref:5-oxoprolinase subunit PxpA n=1 Tax=Cellulophaga TaxID=104264 RepID=UPI001C066F45|nr:MULTISPECIES: 5-oxoprolinase subunit PxpA [Cellulophaga]MBU2997516.1 5-oxoprolinase subunit PxpA [Cellulophaga baltica]MDO6768911.1 5-oxoprolinase subunit PxpA [Cellulophaga sp. 1_MG-2023]